MLRQMIQCHNCSFQQDVKRCIAKTQQVSQMEQTLSRLLLSQLQNIQRSCQAH